MKNKAKAEKSEYPMRINKYLAWKGYSTRKGGDELIKNKEVFINNAVAKLGDKIVEGDQIEVRQKSKPQRYVYFAYYKPRGTVTHSSKSGDKDISENINLKGVFPIGRIDKDSEGLILLTNDGRITDRLLSPKRKHEKEYIVTVKSKLRSNFKQKMEAGVDIEGYTTKKCNIKILGDHTFSIILTEGKKHQIRRMVVALFNEVAGIKRVRIMNIELATQQPGTYRKITGEELRELLKGLGL